MYQKLGTYKKGGSQQTPLIVSIQDSENENLPWSELIKTELFSIGLGGLETTKTNICQAYIQRKLDIFYQNAFSQINDQNSKLNVQYGEIKTVSGFENYLNHIPVKDLHEKVHKVTKYTPLKKNYMHNEER